MNSEPVHDGPQRFAFGDEAGRPPWRKVLYMKQGYPDDYVPPTFLHLLRTNVNVRQPALLPLIRSTFGIALQLSMVVTFAGLFYYLDSARLDPVALIVTSSAVSASLFAATRILGPASTQAVLDSIKTGLLFFSTLLGLSPLLNTLTADFSEDTIWALACLFFGLNLLLQDYRSHTSASLRFPASIATNMAIFASVLLASRLPSTIAVFSLMLLAVVAFVHAPLFYRRMDAIAPGLTASLACFAVVLAAVIWSPIAPDGSLEAKCGNVVFQPTSKGWAWLDKRFAELKDVLPLDKKKRLHHTIKNEAWTDFFLNAYKHKYVHGHIQRGVDDSHHVHARLPVIDDGLPLPATATDTPDQHQGRVTDLVKSVK
ncbi:glycosylphosphatidylinositol anchor biosynthesis [Blastocladiella emersonii ATCC 22665]|nr:glycosylphosphatidylinositol anchor biosynthesis [Blastocladiella emersonii ATCC 22665]